MDLSAIHFRDPEQDFIHNPQQSIVDKTKPALSALPQQLTLPDPDFTRNI